MPNTMEKAFSKTMGKVKKAKARTKRLTGIFVELAEEHGEVAALMLRVDKSSDHAVREELFPEIQRQLLAHERAEQEVLYARLREYDSAQTIVRNHDRDATGVELFLRQLRETDHDTTEWSLIFHNLTETVLRHAKDEENDLFPAAQEILGKDTAEELKNPFLEARQKWLRQLST